MAGSALHLVMFAFQVKISLLMIECLFIKNDDIGIPAFMICMALFAVLFDGMRVAAMESLFRCQVAFDVLMAVSTQAGLMLLTKVRMAL
jgi:hypothetical protein